MWDSSHGDQGGNCNKVCIVKDFSNSVASFKACTSKIWDSYGANPIKGVAHHRGGVWDGSCGSSADPANKITRFQGSLTASTSVYRSVMWNSKDVLEEVDGAI